MPQDPAVIQQQIDETRAELAETIDSIAEIVSPRRVAERAQVQLRAKSAQLREKYGPALGIGPGGGRPELEAAPDGRWDGGADGVPGGVVARIGEEPVPGTTPTVVRVVRWDRVALAAGSALVLLGGLRRRRRRAARRG